jgi:hypothetical protein
MKARLTFGACTLLVFLITGCQNSKSNTSSVEVIIENGARFPDFLVGQWKADRHGWEFDFEPDGTLSSVVISLGRVQIQPGQVTKVPMKLGGKGIFKPGHWTVNYAPDSRELTVCVTLVNFYIEMGDDTLEGSSTDIFVGSISEDGNVWQAKWTAFPNYTAHTAEHPSFYLPTDTVYGITNTLTFEKVPQQ